MKIVMAKSISIGKNGTFIELTCNPEVVWYLVPGARNHRMMKDRHRRMLYFPGVYDVMSCVEAINAAPSVDPFTKFMYDEAVIIYSRYYMRRCAGYKTSRPLKPRKLASTALKIETSYTSL